MTAPWPAHDKDVMFRDSLVVGLGAISSHLEPISVLAQLHTEKALQQRTRGQPASTLRTTEIEERLGVSGRNWSCGGR